MPGYNSLQLLPCVDPKHQSIMIDWRLRVRTRQLPVSEAEWECIGSFGESTIDYNNVTEEQQLLLAQVNEVYSVFDSVKDYACNARYVHGVKLTGFINLLTKDATCIELRSIPDELTGVTCCISRETNHLLYCTMINHLSQSVGDPVVITARYRVLIESLLLISNYKNYIAEAHKHSVLPKLYSAFMHAIKILYMSGFITP